MSESCNEITVKVRKGVSVNIVEVDLLADEDDRMKDDRDLHITLPNQLKVGVKRVSERPDIKANIVTMCG